MSKLQANRNPVLPEPDHWAYVYLSRRPAWSLRVARSECVSWDDVLLTDRPAQRFTATILTPSESIRRGIRWEGRSYSEMSVSRSVSIADTPAGSRARTRILLGTVFIPAIWGDCPIDCDCPTTSPPHSGTFTCDIVSRIWRPLLVGTGISTAICRLCFSSASTISCPAKCD